MYTACIHLVILLLLFSLLLTTFYLFQHNAIYLDDQNTNGTKFKVNNVSKSKPPVHIPKIMLELYRNNENVIKNNYSDIVRSLIPKYAQQLHKSDKREEHLLVFKLPPDDEEGEVFTGAEFRILTLFNYIDYKHLIYVSVYDDVTRQFYKVENLYHQANTTWLSFNLTRIVLNALNAKTLNLELIVWMDKTLLMVEPNLKLSLMPLAVNLEHDYPLLLLSYAKIEKNTNNRQAREKRNVEEDYEEETNMIWDETKWRRLKKAKNICRKRSLYVNFEDIDYDLWIVQPRGYEAYQCQGRCFYPIADHLSPTRHAILQALMHSVHPNKAMKSCCVPTSLDSISILYIDAKGILTYHYAYKDMVVVECGCR